jgi:hypothetical protein
MLCNEVAKNQVLVSLAWGVLMKIRSENLLLASPFQEVLVPTVKTEVTTSFLAIENTAQGFVADTAA